MRGPSILSLPSPPIGEKLWVGRWHYQFNMNRHICCGKSAKKGLHAVAGPKEESKLAWERKAGGCGRGVGVGGGMSLMSRLYSYVSALWVNGANV